MIAALDAQKVICEIATSDDDGPSRRLTKEAPERSIEGRYYFRKSWDFYGLTPDMAPWLLKHAQDYDLVHIHGLFSHVNGLAGRICRRCGIPYVVTPHGMAGHYGMRHKALRKAVSFALIERPLLNGAALIHMTSRREERDFETLKIQSPVVRIPLAVEPLPRGDATLFRASHPEIGSRRLAVFVGRLDRVKNLEAAIDALALPNALDWHLAVCGDGPQDYTKKLKTRADERGAASRISWLGFMDRSEIANVLAAGDVYLQPSLSESFGMAAIEAVSAGLPCVLGENVAVAEELVRANLALVVSPTATNLAGALVRAQSLRKDNSLFAERSQAFVRAHFDSGIVQKMLMNMYYRAAAARHPRVSWM